MADSTYKDTPREHVMREIARTILQSIYNCPEEERNARILQLSKAYGVKVKGNEENKIKTISTKPKIITLCGSTKFKMEFEAKNKELTLAGNIVISVACFGHSGDTFTDEQKVLLDEIHKRKIDLADAIYVINKDGYIGASTRSEIEYAKAHGKEIIFMEAQ